MIVAFTELCSDEKFEFTNINCQNVIEYFFPAGKHASVRSFEPYSCQHAMVMVKSGSITLTGFGLTTYEFDCKAVLPREIKDPVLTKIFDAAVRSFSHNAA